jgi:adenylate cyclase
LTVLFVDVRGSTPLAEGMSPGEYGRLLNRFYAVASEVLIKTDAYIDKFVGDEIMAVYLPLFAGAEPERKAIIAACELLRVTGHDAQDGPWLPVGVGVHTGPAFFGTVAGSEGLFSDFTALGDSVNVASRLVSAAGPGEAVVSEATAIAAGMEDEPFERRDLLVKGKSEPIAVRVLRADAVREL